MGITFKETEYTGTKQPFWRGESKVLPGGFNLTNKLPVGTLIPRGAFVKVDFNQLEATLVKYAVVVGGGTSSKPRVSKNSFLTKDETIKKSGTAEEVKITDIDTSEDGYDTLTLSKSIQELKEGDILFEPSVMPEFVVESNKIVDDMKNITISVSYEAVILKDVLGDFPSEWKDNHYLKNNHNILFINQ